MKLISIITFILSTTIHARSIVSLSPSLNGLMRSEAMTATGNTNEALLYNPALLATDKFSLQLVSSDIIADKHSSDLGKDLEKKEGFDSRELISENLNQSRHIFASGGANILNLSIPYFGLKSFAYASVFSKKPKSNQYDLDMLIRFGVTTGFAISLGDLKIGYSLYVIKQANIDTNPNQTQVDAIKTAIENGTLDSLDLSGYTTMRYGEALGHNLGFLLKLGDGDNHSALGLSFLNLGGTHFGGDKHLRGDFKKITESASKEAKDLGITLYRPQKIEQLINLGLHLSSDRGADNVFHTAFSIDYQDIGGSTLEEKLTMSTEFGINLPSNLALLTSLPLIKTKNTSWYVGLSGLDMIISHRPKESLRAGVELKLHSGPEKVYSLIQGSIKIMGSKSLNKTLFPETEGLGISIGLKFLLPNV